MIVPTAVVRENKALAFGFQGVFHPGGLAWTGVSCQGRAMSGFGTRGVRNDCIGRRCPKKECSNQTEIDSSTSTKIKCKTQEKALVQPDISNHGASSANIRPDDSQVSSQEHAAAFRINRLTPRSSRASR